MTGRQYQLLQVLSERPAYPLELAERAELALGFTLDCLYQLHDLGLIDLAHVGGRKQFWLTPAGVRAASRPRVPTLGERLRAIARTWSFP